MAVGYQALSEKEKQTLRLIVRGHDAKSMAGQLGLSVHTVNERLRDARRKLEVSSSRQAARLLADAENDDPQKFADEKIGEAIHPAIMEQDEASLTLPRRHYGTAGIVTGAIVMAPLLGLLIWSFASGSPTPTVAASAPAVIDGGASVAVSDSAVVRSARDWLILGDQSRWKESYGGTTASFRSANSLARWTDVSKQVRAPLGAVISRTALSQESVPAPPNGVEVVKFRTSFANKANAIETVSLAKEAGVWKVVGIYLE